MQARLEDTAQCLLIIIGATPEGSKELVGLTDGVRESAQSWRELLLDLKRRGLAIGPELAIADGALGFWQAIEEVWPQTRGQRCWVHFGFPFHGRCIRVLHFNPIDKRTRSALDSPASAANSASSRRRCRGSNTSKRDWSVIRISYGAPGFVPISGIDFRATQACRSSAVINFALIRCKQ